MTDVNGHFLLLAAAGVYTIKASPESGGAFPRPASTVVTVRTGQVITVQVVVDSGVPPLGQS